MKTFKLSFNNKSHRKLGFIPITKIFNQSLNFKNKINVSAIKNSNSYNHFSTIFHNNGVMNQNIKILRYAKGKGGKNKNKEESEDEGDSDFDIQAFYSSFEKKLEDSLNHVKNEMSSVQTGKASPDLLNKLQVKVDGSNTTVQQLAQVSVANPQMLIVNVYDEAHLKLISQAITSSDLGFIPQTENNQIKVPIPKISNEIRQKLVKQLAKISEQGKISSRNLRQTVMKSLKKEKLPEDIEKQSEKKLQTILDGHIKQIDTLQQTKEKDILK
eukprot:TRINITY_DN617_c0_g1_i1.p2 TRINITY_DN617_c0_g1~~TRINITY_DN617_c0_g1_i1.p2  ORF type:complete len:271 (+),score=87.91 TRINITY_DN617_c0_g1_i1:1046-1858(+)